MSKFITIIPKVIIVFYVIKWILSAIQGPYGKNDFLIYWVASSQALAGNPGEIYDFTKFHAAMVAAGGRDFLIAPWFYPPVFLLLVLPLSFLPYHVSLTVWLALTLGCFLLVVWRIAPHRATIWLSLAFPGTLVNLDYGQNGLFSTALLGGGLLLLERQPLVAGVLFGLLGYKPNLAVLIPVALIAGRYWKALGISLITYGALTLASGLVLGWDTWIAFWHIRHLPMQVFETEVAAKMLTIPAAIRLVGGGIWLGYTLQGAVMVAMVAAVAWVWSQGKSPAVRVSTLALGTLLFTPYALEYELVLLAIPIAWVGWESYHAGCQPREKIFLILAWVTPAIARFSSAANIVQITPLILLFLLCLNLTSKRLFGVPAGTGSASNEVSKTLDTVR